jgi:hypothetical protein
MDSRNQDTAQKDNGYETIPFPAFRELIADLGRFSARTVMVKKNKRQNSLSFFGF